MLYAIIDYKNKQINCCTMNYMKKYVEDNNLCKISKDFTFAETFSMLQEEHPNLYRLDEILTTNTIRGEFVYRFEGEGFTIQNEDLDVAAKELSEKVNQPYKTVLARAKTFLSEDSSKIKRYGGIWYKDEKISPISDFTIVYCG